jgi:hypothetical protein
MRLVVLLGSGASTSAGMPCVGTITARVLSGENVFRHGDQHFYTVEEIEPHHETKPVEDAVSFLRELKEISDAYFAVREPERETNYEDIAYFARQIDHALSFEYENRALVPLIERLVGGPYSGRNPYQLKAAASQAADYIEDVVCALLSGPRNDLGFEGDYGMVASIRARCSRCGHETESFGTGERSIQRCLALMREECPAGESNFYAADAS